MKLGAQLRLMYMERRNSGAALAAADRNYFRRMDTIKRTHLAARLPIDRSGVERRA
jgi:hypothetical protein